MKKVIKTFLLLISVFTFSNVYAECKCQDSKYVLNGTKCTYTYQSYSRNGVHYCPADGGSLTSDQKNCEITVDAVCDSTPVPKDDPDVDLSQYEYVCAAKSRSGVYYCDCGHTGIKLVGTGCYKLKEKTPSQDKEKKKTDSEKVDDTAVSCPLGPEVTKDLYGILKVIKIVAPIMCFALSVYDLIICITKGEIESESKKVFQKFGKRLIYVALLYFVPMVVNALMIYLNVWDSNGICDLSEDPKSSEEEKSKSFTITNYKYTCKLGTTGCEISKVLSVSVSTEGPKSYCTINYTRGSSKSQTRFDTEKGTCNAGYIKFNCSSNTSAGNEITYSCEMKYKE